MHSSPRSLVFSWWAVSALLLLVLILLGGVIFRNFEQLETMRGHAIYAHRIQAVAADIQAALTDFFLAENRDDHRAKLDRLTAEIIDLAKNDLHVAPETPAKLEALRHSVDVLTHTKGNDEQQEALLVEALSYTNSIMDFEALHRQVLLERLSHATRTEIGLVFATVIALMVMIGFFIRYRILSPLNDLQKLLLRLAKEDFTPIETHKIDPMLQPIFGSYNLMVGHLAELEEGKRLYAQSLEAEVRHAAATLLEQQVGLARNERLAAVGELAAGIAHELRNPLAGIQMSCANLRHDFQDPDKIERMSLVIEELKRMARLLNELLDLSKHTPAPVDVFDLPELIRELTTLLRYQIPERIELVLDLPKTLGCRLPSSRIRQCLLNLILNASQAIAQGSGRIVIRVTDLGNDRVFIAVIDDGPGFTDDILNNGIRPFSTGKTSGTGLGLAMVQRFVRELGGQMKLGRNEPKGAIVTLIVPTHNA